MSKANLSVPNKSACEGIRPPGPFLVSGFQDRRNYPSLPNLPKILTAGLEPAQITLPGS